MLVLNHITHRIDSKPLVHEVSVAIQPGTMTAVVGANGAGKTTLLRIASGEFVPSEGAVSMNGIPLRALSAQQQAGRRAVLPQHSHLSFSFPVREVVLLGRTPHRSGMREAASDWQIAHLALEHVAMSNFAHRDYSTLSGGEQQRVHLARALAQIWEVPTEGHRYLLLDEPTASLDIKHQHSVLNIAHRFARKGVGVLAVLHDLNLAAQYADHVVVLHQGRVLVQGRPQDVLTPDVIQAAFGVQVIVRPHPCNDCPLVVTVPEGRPSHLPASVPPPS